MTLVTFTDKSFSCSGFSDFSRAKDMLLSLHLGNQESSVENQDTGTRGRGDDGEMLPLHEVGITYLNLKKNDFNVDCHHLL